MGGPGGTGPILNFAHSRVGNVYQAEDFYQSSSCVNCHERIPPNSCNACHSQNPFSSSSFLLRPSPCNAEMRWPIEFQEGIPHIQDHPWWVKQNYLSTQIKKAGNPIRTDQIQLGLEVLLRPNQSLQAGDYKLDTQNGSIILFEPHLAGRGENLSILLEGENLLRLQNIRVTPATWYATLLPHNWLQEVGIKEGRLFLKAAIGALNLFRSTQNPAYSEIDLQNQILPLLPIAYNSNNGEIYTANEYEKLKDNPPAYLRKIDILAEIYENGQFPPLFKLSDLFKLIEDFRAIAKLKAPSEEIQAPSAFENAVSSIRFHLNTLPDEIRYPSFYAKFESKTANPLSLKIVTQGLTEISQVQAEGRLNLVELLIPRWLHLSASQANMVFSYQVHKGIALHLNQVQARVEPNSYFSDNARKLGIVELMEGEVRDGEKAQHLGLRFEPGIHIEQAGNNIIELSINLFFQFKIRVPALGELEISSPLLLRTQLAWNAFEIENPRLMPQCTFFALPDLSVKLGKQTQAYQGNLSLTDIPEFKISNQEQPLENGFSLSFIGESSLDNTFPSAWIEAFVPIQVDETGNYEFNSLKKFFDFSLESQMKFSNGKSVLAQVSAHQILDGKSIERNLQADAQQCSAGTDSCEALIEGLKFSLVQTQEIGWAEYDIQLAAQLMRWGLIQILQTDFHLKYLESEQSGKKRYSISHLQLSGNPKGKSPKMLGVFRGPFSIQKRSKDAKPIELEYDPTKHRMKLEKLDLGFNFTRLHFPLLTQFTSRAISGVDLDGALLGNWDFDTETYAGKGRLIFRGDREGDIHLRGSRGRRLEAALDPLDPHRVYQIPLLANTRFVIRRLEAFDPQSEQLKGHFHLSTLVDWLALKGLGINWNQHDEFIFDFDHLPYSLEGYSQKIREFFTHIATQETRRRTQP